jgi:hypothetical protein
LAHNQANDNMPKIGEASKAELEKFKNDGGSSF